MSDPASSELGGYGATCCGHDAAAATLTGENMANEDTSLVGRRILLLEDEYIIASEMEAWLRGAGAEVEGPWPSADEAVAAINRPGNAVDAGVLDVNLRYGGTALAVAQRLDSLGVPYLLATGNTLGIDEPLSKGHPRLEKPVSARVLLKAVRELLADRVPRQRSTTL